MKMIKNIYVTTHNAVEHPGTSELAELFDQMDDEQTHIYMNLLSAVKQLIQREKEEIKKYSLKDDYYYRWISTSSLADVMGVKNSWLRYRLNKMEQAGFVESKRSANYCMWCPTVIPGYQKHTFNDYVCKAE